MKTSTTFRLLLLILAPLLGCATIAWQGAHRPEHLILGKWQTSQSQSTIEFRADGTFSYLGVESEFVPPTPDTRLVGFVPPHSPLYQTRGAYFFSNGNHLELWPQLPGIEVGKMPANGPLFQARSMTTTFHDDAVDVNDGSRSYSGRVQTWKRIG